MRFSRLIPMIILTACVGCGTTSGGGGESRESEESARASHDGLVEVEIDGPGHLFLRTDHGIGGYDAIAVAPAFVTYRRTSAKIEPENEEIYLVSMEQAIIDAADAAEVPVVNVVGECVIKIGAGFLNVDLARSDTAEVLGTMTLVIEYQDSLSGQSLLRYYAPQHVNREGKGMSREEQISRSFDRMIEEVDIVSALRKATAVPSKPREGCKGDLIRARGRDEAG